MINSLSAIFFEEMKAKANARLKNKSDNETDQAVNSKQRKLMVITLSSTPGKVKKVLVLQPVAFTKKN